MRKSFRNMAESSKGKLVIVEWEVSGKEVDEKRLKTFIKAKSNAEPIINLGKYRRIALLEFKEDNDVNFLRNQWKSGDFWTITNISVVPETKMIKVTNLPKNANRRDVNHYFTNENMVNLKLDVDVMQEYFHPEKGFCVLNLSSSSDAKRACREYKKFKEFRKCQLAVEPYYGELETLTELSTGKVEEIKPITVDNIDNMKMKFMKDFCKVSIEQQFKSACANIFWAREGRNKVGLKFDCEHNDLRQEHGRTWEKNVRQLLQNIMDDIVVVRKNLSVGVWDKVQEVLISFPLDSVLIDEEADEYRLTIVGHKKDSAIAKLEKDIDAIQPPKPIVKKDVTVSNKIKLAAFADLQMGDTVGGVTVDCQVSAGVIRIHGDKETIDKAEIEILEILNQIVVESSNFSSKEAANILITPLMCDKIESCKDDLGERCGYLIEKDTLYVFSTGQANLEKFEKKIKALIIEEDKTLQGKVENESTFKAKIKDIEDIYTPYVKLTSKISKENVVIHIVCGKDYYGPVCNDINEKVETLLVTKEKINISPHIVKYIQKKSIENIHKAIKQSGLPKDVFESDAEKAVLHAKGNARVRQQVVGIVQTEAKKIQASWRQIEKEGIHDYFADGEGYKFLLNEIPKHQCEFRIATQYEMKNEDMHCIVTLETGQALFVGAGTLENPNLPVDVIVNAANTKLEHRGGLAAVLVKAGGKSIQADCTDYINKNGELQPGDIYVGPAGKLPCQRIIHAVGPEWKGGNSNEDKILQTVVENILEAMNRDKEFILRSVAIPLLSAGVFGFPRSRSAKIILDTMKNKLKSTPNVREIYFYDPNPDIVRTIQKQMHGVFGDKCFHLPMRNIAVGKGTMTKFAASKHFKLERSGTRTLPLPGGTKIIIKWGDLQTTAAEVLVNATPTAPTPSGKISDGLKYAAGVGFDMESECNKAFKKVCPGGNVPDGMMVLTKAGRIPCSEIYHLKIDNNKSSGCNSLAGYITTCLKEAVRQKRTTIAFPTIGTADCDYPGDKVALTFIRTIGEFMQLHITCSLTEITIVIYKTDIVTTSALEVILEKLYSQRPHRLIADIEETVETKDGEKEEVNTSPKQRQPSPKRSRPRSAVHRNRVQKQNEGSFAIDDSDGAALDLEVGGIESSKADAIVCTTSSFPKLNGAITTAITKAGGPDIQKECNRCYKSYPDQGVAATNAGNLSCKKVYYTVLKDYTPANAKNVSDYVLKCLEQAEKDKFTSIAMPTFGTGGFKYPDQVSASQMFTAIKEFFKKKRSSLKLIVVVMYGPAQQTCQTFYQEAAKFFTQMKAPTKTVVAANTAQAQNVDNLLWSVPKSSTSLEITYGNLELAKADVILDTTTSFPNLIGIIPVSLSKRAGPQLKEECKRFKGNVSPGMIFETKGYDLDCKQVYHYLMPDWKESDGEQTISNCIDDCLQKMKQSGLRSVAIPSIGTGGARYNPRKVARGIYSAVADFGAANGNVNCHVNLVLFPAAKDINKTFTEELQGFMSGKTNEQKPPVKGVRFAEDGDDKGKIHVDDDIVIPTKRRDFLLIQFTSDDSKNVDLAFKSIKTKVERETRDVQIDLTKESNIDDLDLVNKGKNKKTIEDIGEDYHVKVIVDTKARKVKVRGLGDGVIKCYERILRFLQERRHEAVSKDIGKIVYQHIEWYYTEDDGKIWVPYPRHIRYLLEDANSTKVTEKEFRDINEKLYVVDFTKMEEYVKGDKKKETTVTVIRKDLTEGALQALPHTWQAMGESENLKEVLLNSTDQEYKDVEANFRATIGNYGLSQIKEIRRIQNRTLYQQYQTKKEQLKSEHKNVPNLEIERTLWHGTQEDKEKSITSNGFNRSYAGATFQGKLWYGVGVYFAVNSEYSTQQFYSPPDSSGWKRIYQVKVLTGLTTPVQQGYMERFAPQVPGSAIDRYNSTCDDGAIPTEFVIYNDTQAYPEYIILFK